VVSDGTPEPAYTRDPELYHQPTTWPGAHLPHCWLGREGHRVSTLDVVGKGRFVVLTGITGRPWADATVKLAEQFGVDIEGMVIGPGADLTDLYDDWSRLREVDEDGCVLVRPDAHVAWRAARLVTDPTQTLTHVLNRILDR